MKSSVLEHYEGGRMDRRKFPLPSGLYKLKELHRYPSRILDTLSDLTEHRRSKRTTFYTLSGASPAEWACGWIKELAYRAGKDLLPSIAALTVDGIRETEVRQVMAYLRHRESGLLTALEDADTQIHLWGGSYEYDLWSEGESALVTPCMIFLSIQKAGLCLVDCHLPGALSDRDRLEYFSPQRGSVTA